MEHHKPQTTNSKPYVSKFKSTRRAFFTLFTKLIPIRDIYPLGNYTPGFHKVVHI
jgi:hypothetical protein